MSWRLLLNPAYLVALGILVVSALSLGRAIDVMEIYLLKLPINPEGNRKLRQVLSETEHWIKRSADIIESADIVKSLGTDNYVSRAYALKSDPSVVVDFHAAYYTGMVDTVPHVPERCFVGGGWQLDSESKVVPIPLESDYWTRSDNDESIYEVRVSNDNEYRPGQRVPLPRGVTPDGGLRMRVSRFLADGRQIHSGYFFIANGGTVARSEDVRLLAFRLDDDYAYYLKVQFTSPTVESPEELAELAGRLLDDLLPELMLCVPDWSEVEAGVYPPNRNEDRRSAG